MSANSRDHPGQTRSTRVVGAARGIVAFDLDGTLIPDSTVCLHLSRWLGHDDLPELEARYARGEITNREVAEADAAFYAGRTRDEVWQRLEDLDVIGGIPETIGHLRATGFVPVIATVTWKGAAEFVARRYGFEACCGCELAYESGVLTGRVARHIEAEGKVDFVTEVAKEHGLDNSSVIAVGDSTSDIPLFESAGLAIALNASQNAKDVADVHIETSDLRDVIPPIENYFSRT